MKAWAYKDFKIDELFTVTSSKKKFNANDVTFGGRYPYVVRTSDNNGIRGFIDEDVKYLNDGKTISFGQDTATIFYQELPYFTGDKIKVLSPKFNIDNRIAVYMLSCMRKSFSNFQWGVSSFNETILKSIEIRIPVTSSGEVDFAFMQARIQEMEQARIQEMDAYLKVAGFENCELTDEEEIAITNIKSTATSKFKIGNLYNVVELKNKPFDKRRDSRQTPDSKYILPLVNAKHGDNGIMYYGDPTVFDSVDMTIDIVQNGEIATGDVYPQPQSTGVLWDAYLIRASQHQDNVDTLLYFSTAIGKSIKKKYSYDNKAYWNLVKEETIVLPVTSSGNIDYHFMETYIRAQEKLAIQRVKDWREKEIATTKEVVNADTVRPTSKKKRNARFIYIIPSSEIAPSQRYTTHLPVYPLRAACGYFDECGSLPEEEAEGWIDASNIGRKLNENMFVVHTEGRSMEPTIHDGDLCVFERTAGSHQGKIVLAKAKDELDPEAGSYTIKKYSSEKCIDEDGVWHHTRVVLSPLNMEFQPIVLESEGTEEGDFKIYAELVQVIEKQ